MKEILPRKRHTGEAHAEEYTGDLFFLLTSQQARGIIFILLLLIYFTLTTKYRLQYK